MRSVWMLAALALLAGCDPGNRGDAIAAERPQAVAPGQGQAGGVLVPGIVMDTEAGATTRLMAAIAAATQTDIAKAHLARGKAGSPDVRAYAVALVEHHRRALGKLAELSRDKKLDVRTMSHDDAQVRALAATGDEEIDRLRGLSGRAFDEAFLTDQLTTTMLLERYGVEGQRVTRDPDLDYFFVDTMSQAQMHRDDTQRIIPVACPGMPNIPSVFPGAGRVTPSTTLRQTQGEVPAAASPDPAVRDAQPGGGSSMQIGAGQGARDEKAGLENTPRAPYP